MQLPFNKNNIFIILIGVFLIFVGYLLMSLEDFKDATEFSMALYICPILIIAGHIVIAVGIISKGNNSQKTNLDSKVPNASKKG